MDTLPLDIFDHIALKLDETKDVVSLQQICKSYAKSVARYNNGFWANWFIQKYGNNDGLVQICSLSYPKSNNNIRISNKKHISIIYAKVYDIVEQYLGILHISFRNNNTHLLLDVLKTSNSHVNGFTPLHYAAATGHYKLVKLIVETAYLSNQYTHHDNTYACCVADIINAVDLWGRTALFLAASYGHDDVVKFLLQVPDVNPNIAERVGNTLYDWNPLHVACAHGRDICVQLLLQHPAVDINCTSDFGEAPIHTAIFEGHSDVIRVLLDDTRLDINKPSYNIDFNNETPLHIACKIGNVNIVKQLLQCPSINVNAVTMDDHWTPLHFACSEGHLDVVQALLHYPNINVHVMDAYGMSPIDIACSKKHGYVVGAFLLPSSSDSDSDEAFD